MTREPVYQPGDTTEPRPPTGTLAQFVVDLAKDLDLLTNGSRCWRPSTRTGSTSTRSGSPRGARHDRGRAPRSRAACPHPRGARLPPFPAKLDKSPLTTNGYLDATRDEAAILRWWDRWPTASPAIACGASGIVAQDIDSKHGADLHKVLQVLGIDPARATIVTTGIAPPPSARYPNSLEGVPGAHVYWRGTHRKLAATAIPGVGLWGEGAYLIAPGSPHPSGVTYKGRLPAVRDLPELPQSVLDALGPVAVDSSATVADGEPFPEGDRHERLLAWGRSRYTAHGVLGEAALLGMLKKNEVACRPPLPDSEVQRLWAHLENTRIAGANAPRAPDRRLDGEPPMSDDGSSASNYRPRGADGSRACARQAPLHDGQPAPDAAALARRMVGVADSRWAEVGHARRARRRIRVHRTRRLPHEEEDRRREPVPWAPTRKKIADLLDALAAVCHLPETVDQPAWLDGAAAPA